MRQYDQHSSWLDLIAKNGLRLTTSNCSVVSDRSISEEQWTKVRLHLRTPLT